MEPGIRSKSQQLTVAPASPVLLATKLAGPRPRRDAVPRPRLLARLDGALACPLTLIVAPAGFGKTTLLAAWVAAAASPAPSVAWLALDPGDNDPARFAHYLVAAVGRALPQVGSSLLALPGGPGALPLDAVATALANELGADGRELALVLDDVHVITAGPVLGALALLAEQGPPNLHLVLAGRSEPELGIPRLRARGQLLELHAGDLRFEPAEAAAMLNDTMGLALTPSQVQALERRTEGWAAGLQLAALALRGRPDAAPLIDRFAGDQRFVFDYLSSDVLDGLPSYLRDFLLRTAVLDQLCAELCDAVLGEAPGPGQLRSAALLDELERRNLFLVPLDERRAWYRYHHLFADVLRAQLRRVASPGDVAALRRRAGDWLAENGYIAEAVEQLLAAGAHEPAAALIAAHSFAMFFAGRIATVEGWVAALPEGLVRQRPALATVAASAAMFAGRMADAGAFVELGERLLDASGSPQLRAELMALRSLLLSVGERYAESVVIAEHALAELPAGSPLRPMVAAGLSFAAIIAGDLAHSEQIARRTLGELGEDPGTLWLRVHFYTMLGIAARLRGRLREAESFCGRAVALLDESPVPAPTPTALPALNEAAVVRFQRDDLDGAAELQRRCAALVAGSADRTLWLPVRWVEARLAAARGDLAGALALLERAAASARVHAGPQRPAAAPNTSMRLAVIEAERVRLCLRMGNLAAAEAAAADLAALGLPPEQPAPYAEVSLAVPRLLMGRGDHAGAIATLGRLVAAAERAGFSGLASQALALRAVAQHAAGSMAAAEADLARALASDEVAANVRTWLDEGEPLRAALATVRPRLLVRGAADTATERALRGCEHLLARFADEGARRPAAPPPTPQRLAEPLTERELDVLRLLAAGRSNREIAAELVVALGTVKRHVANLCAKLGAPSRLAAVALARERGVI